MPPNTDEVDKIIENKSVFLKPLLNNKAVIFGITIKDEINNIPTNFIETIIVMATKTVNK